MLIRISLNSADVNFCMATIQGLLANLLGQALFASGSERFGLNQPSQRGFADRVLSADDIEFLHRFVEVKVHSTFRYAQQLGDFIRRFSVSGP